jgi:hypothetical protein
MRASANTVVCLITSLLLSCGGGSSTKQPSPPPPSQLYLPLAVGNTWTYACNHNGGSISDTVTQTVTVNGQLTYAMQMEFPNGPPQTMLLANDAQGNTTFYGYLVNGTPMPVTPSLYVSANPQKGEKFDYPALGGGIVNRAFAEFTVTNPTTLGVLPVAVYNENGLPAYGYDAGKGVMEQDHNYPQFDCTVISFHVH